MSQLTKTQFDTTYNQSNSGSFLNNTQQKIKAGTIRQFAKDIEDSIPFLLGSNTFTVSNSSSINITGNTTSNTVSEFAIQRSGAASTNVATGSNIQLLNTTSNKRILLQSSDDIFQIFNYDSSSWTERARIDSTGMLRLGQISTTLAVADTSIGLLKAGYSTSDSSVFHIAGFFQSEQTAATTFSIQGVEGYTKISHGSGTVTLAIGTIGNIELASTHTLSIARSLQAGGNTSAAGTITEWDGLYINFANAGSAMITSAYGIYLDTFPSGVTNKYGIVIAEGSAKSGFGVTGATAMVDILGSSTSISSLRIRNGTAPTSPNDGDMWYDGTNVKFRVGGTTKTFTLI